MFELKGILTEKLKLQSGESAKGTWEKQTIVVEVTQDKYKKNIAMDAWNEKATDLSKLAIGTELKIGFDIDSREYNGKWYTNAKIVWVNVENEVSQKTSAKTEENFDDANGLSDDDINDLPF